MISAFQRAVGVSGRDDHGDQRQETGDHNRDAD